MCGIVATVDPRLDVERCLDRIAHRGPDDRGLVEVEGVRLGHVRLAIQDLSDASAQPFAYGDLTLAYNGELWNAPALRERLGGTWRTTGDTEVVAAVLERYGVDGLHLLEGMFAVAWTTGDGVLYAARDRFGEVPLHYGRGLICSERKAIPGVALADVPAGSWLSITDEGKTLGEPYYELPTTQAHSGLELSAALLRVALDSAMVGRAVADVDLSVLLSGGIDSAVIAAGLVAAGCRPRAYTAVLDERSRDLRCARAVAHHLGLELVEVRVPVPTSAELAETVGVIEQPHKAQVEIAWACRHLAAAIASDGLKVTFTGEGSDELWASYGFAYHGVNEHGWFDYRRRLYGEQQRKNFPRANKAFMGSGVEVRLPFCHTSVVELALSLPESSVRAPREPKAVLARAYADALPDEVLRRPKVAFQDGMGLKAAIARDVEDPAALYRSTYARLYP